MRNKIGLKREITAAFVVIQPQLKQHYVGIYFCVIWRPHNIILSLCVKTSRKSHNTWHVTYQAATSIQQQQMQFCV